jgi:pimeloyl-ACP methyl ester carboxylesterase
MPDAVTVKRLVLVVAVGAVAIAMIGDQRRRDQPVHQAEWLAAGDALVRTVRAGRGDTTLLLLHGYGESLISFRPIFDLLARHYRVVALDLPGFGLSDKPIGSYSLATTVVRIQNFIARWIRGPVVIVGHSMGGEIAAAVGLAQPPPVKALVLISPAGYALGPWLGDSTVSWPRKMWVGSTIAYMLPMHDPAWLSEPADRAEYEPFSDPAYRESSHRVLEQFDFAALRGRFANVTQPTLVIWGERDPTIPLSVGDSIVRELPLGQLVIIKGALHRPQETHPDEVVAQIERFLGRDPDTQ